MTLKWRATAAGILDIWDIDDPEGTMTRLLFPSVGELELFMQGIVDGVAKIRAQVEKPTVFSREFPERF